MTIVPTGDPPKKEVYGFEAASTDPGPTHEGIALMCPFGMAGAAFSEFAPDEDVKVIIRGALRVYVDDYIAVLDDRRLDLTPKEFELLVAFASNPGRVMRRERLSQEVWGGAAPGRTIDIHVARIRRQLPPGAIETVIRVGYRFVLA